MVTNPILKYTGIGAFVLVSGAGALIVNLPRDQEETSTAQVQPAVNPIIPATKYDPSLSASLIAPQENSQPQTNGLQELLDVVESTDLITEQRPPVVAVNPDQPLPYSAEFHETYAALLDGNQQDSAMIVYDAFKDQMPPYFTQTFNFNPETNSYQAGANFLARSDARWYVTTQSLQDKLQQYYAPILANLDSDDVSASAFEYLVSDHIFDETANIPLSAQHPQQDENARRVAGAHIGRAIEQDFGFNQTPTAAQPDITPTTYDRFATAALQLASHYPMVVAGPTNDDGIVTSYTVIGTRQQIANGANYIDSLQEDRR